MTGSETVRQALREPAPAKINLFLHVVGRRPDGLHLIDSLVTFAEAGDVVRVAPADGLLLTRSGPMAGRLPPPDDDLVLRAARALAAAAEVEAGAAIALEKNLPVAGGLGGGSADAAAALRALARLWRVDLGAERLAALAPALGADVPVCLAGTPARVGGVGERLTPVGRLAPLAAVLVNPGTGVATADVFAAFDAAGGAAPPASASAPPDWGDPTAVARWLAGCRNDLTGAAMSLCPAIGEVLDRLAVQPGCRLARMSGSGASCFGLFASAAAAADAAAALGRQRPRWWVAATRLGAGGKARRGPPR